MGLPMTDQFVESELHLLERFSEMLDCQANTSNFNEYRRHADLDHFRKEVPLVPLP